MLGHHLNQSYKRATLIKGSWDGFKMAQIKVVSCYFSREWSYRIPNQRRQTIRLVSQWRPHCSKHREWRCRWMCPRRATTIRRPTEGSFPWSSCRTYRKRGRSCGGRLLYHGRIEGSWGIWTGQLNNQQHVQLTNLLIHLFEFRYALLWSYLHR